MKIGDRVLIKGIVDEIEQLENPCSKEHGCIAEVMQIIDKYAEQEPTIPCDLCGFNTGEFCRYLGECPAIPKGGE